MALQWLVNSSRSCIYPTPGQPLHQPSLSCTHILVASRAFAALTAHTMWGSVSTLQRLQVPAPDSVPDGWVSVGKTRGDICCAVWSHWGTHAKTHGCTFSGDSTAYLEIRLLWMLRSEKTCLAEEVFSALLQWFVSQLMGGSEGSSKLIVWTTGQGGSWTQNALRGQ